jgi:CDP-glycerol glycerophosphotransferase
MTSARGRAGADAETTVPGGSPRLSVVVPVYNVRDYLDACLDSLATQTLTDLEVVMVDDGSTDDSAMLAQAWVDRDPRFRLVRQTNHGLGHARNTGVAHSTGEYLAFVDSDDVIPHHAYELMVGTLERTGSDFVTGNVQRLKASGTEQSVLHADAFATTRLRTHVTRDKSLMRDRLAPNKVWRRSFWDEHELAFPVGVLYEDIPVTIPAHFLAQNVDVVKQVVYLWRVREERTSITQDRTHLRGLEDRFTAVNGVRRFLEARSLKERGPKREVNWFDEVVLASDIRIFVKVLDEADDAFVARFTELATAYLDQVDAKVFRRLPAIERVQYAALRAGRLDELAELTRFARLDARFAGVERRGDRYLGRFPYLGDAEVGIPDEAYDVTREIELVSRVTDVRWRRGGLDVEGWAHLDRLPAAEPGDQRIRAWLTSAVGRLRIPLRVRALPSPEATVRAEHPQADVGAAGFRVTLPARLVTLLHRRGHERWWVDLEVVSGGLTRTGRLRDSGRGPVRRPEPRDRGRVRLQPTYEDDGRFVLRVRPVDVLVDAVDGGTDPAGAPVVRLQGSVHGGWVDGSRLVVARRHGTAEVVVAAEPGGTRRGRTPFTAELPVTELLADLDVADTSLDVESSPHGVAWKVQFAVGRKKKRLPVVLGGDVADIVVPVSGREIAVRRGRTGAMALEERWPRPRLRVGAWSGSRLVLEGAFAPGPDVTAALVLVARTADHELAAPVELSADGAFRVEFAFDAATQPWGIPVPTSSYDLRADLTRLRSDGTRAVTRVVVPVDAQALPALPVDADVEGRRHRLVDTADGAAVLEVAGLLRDDERGTFHRHQLRQRYASLRDAASGDGGLLDQVVLDGYEGRRRSRDLLAVGAELHRRRPGLKQVWVVREHPAQLRDALASLGLGDAEIVLRHSREWYEALARSSHVVTNSHLPEFYRRASGQVCLQTWHASLLRPVGFGLAATGRMTRTRLDRLVDETAQWTHLVSPAPVFTPSLVESFRFTGEVLETGGPRNDALNGADRDARRAAVRARLGIADDARVVLYTPTHRADAYDVGGRSRIELPIELGEVRRALGDGHVVLFRKHPDTVGRLDVDDPAVLDVSRYPDVGELYLAADVLVTDRSSVMFDFAGLGRPMLFLDLDGDRFEAAGVGEHAAFVAKVVADLPGPVLRSQAELVDALRDLDAVQAAHADALRTFAETYGPLDDGHAAARVVDAIWD